MAFDAFISYSHAADGRLAPALQSALHRLARPWYRIRACRLFRDKTSLSANPGLWPSIERALAESAYLLLLASAEAARSPWVEREVAWWLEHRPGDRLLIAVTDGELTWDAAAGDFDWAKTTVLPPSLRGRFRDEPLYVDLRWARSAPTLSLRSPQFRDAVLDLSATLRGRPKDELDGEDVRQHRLTRALASAAVVLIVAGAALAAWQAIVASRERRVAEAQRDLAEQRYQAALGRQLAIQADWTRAGRADQLPLSVLLATEAMRRLPSIETEQALRAGLALLPRRRWRALHPEGPPVGVGFSPDGKRILTAEGVFDATTGRLIAKLAHEGRSTALATSADGRFVARGGGGPAGVWDAVTGRPVTPPLKNVGPVTALAFSPDGGLLAVASRDKIARVWETTTGKLVQSIQVPGEITGVAFSPDGRHLAASRQTEVRRWDAATWQPVPGAITTESSVRSFAFGPDGRVVATLAGTQVGVWDVTGARRAAFSLGADAGQQAVVAFSPDGRYVGASAQTSQVWDVATGQQVVRTEHGGAIAFSPDSRRVATGGADNVARVVDLGTGREIARVAHEAGVVAVAFSPDGESLVTMGADGFLAMSDVSAGGEGARIDGVPARFIDGGRFLVTTVEDRAAVLWDVKSERQTRLPATGSARSVRLGPDGSRLVAASGDVVTVWELPAARQIARLEHRPAIDWEAVRRREADERRRSNGDVGPQIERMQAEGSIDVVAVSPDSRYLVTTRADEIARVWDVERGQETARVPYATRIAVAFSPDGARVAMVSAGEGVRVWESATGRALGSTEPEQEVRTLAFSRDGRHVVGTVAGGVRVWEVGRAGAILAIPDARSATFAADGNVLVTDETNAVRLRDLERGRELAAITCPRCQIRSVVLSPDRRLLAITGTDGALRIHPVAPGGVTRELTEFGDADEIVFSPDSTRLATITVDWPTSEAEHPGRPSIVSGAASGWVHVWDVRTGGELASVRHDAPVISVVWSPDGRLVASDARVWEAATGKQITRVEGRISAFSPDMALLVSRAGGTTRVWRWRSDDLLAAACERLTRNFTRAEWRRFVGEEPYRTTCANRP